MNSFVSGWYVIYTRPKQERKIFTALCDANVKCYLPMIKKLSQWHDRQKIIDAPLFPGYIFIQLTSVADFYTGTQVSGFIKYLKCGNQFSRVAASIIDNLKGAMNGENIEASVVQFAPGQKLIINSGPLTGCNCELVEYNGKKKALIRVNLLNRNVLVDAPVEIMSAREKVAAVAR